MTAQPKRKEFEQPRECLHCALVEAIKGWYKRNSESACDWDGDHVMHACQDVVAGIVAHLAEPDRSMMLDMLDKQQRGLVHEVMQSASRGATKH